MDRTGLENQIRTLGGDPGFVFFLLDRSFPIRKRKETFPVSSKENAALSQKIKRQIQKQRPENWKPCWDEMKKTLRVGRETLFSLESKAGFSESYGRVSRIPVEIPGSQLPGGYVFREIQGTGRPVDLSTVRQWGTICILITYFRRISGKPHWATFADLVNFSLQEERWDYSNIQIAWQSRKKDFDIYNPAAFLDSKLEFYRICSGEDPDRIQNILIGPNS
ncbi:MAG: hypothetical protein ACYC9S_11660 [Leptospirales bacterium]